MTEPVRDNLLSEEEERFIEIELNQTYKYEKDYAEIREKLGRLNRTSATTASDLLNDIYQSMNSKVKSIPEVIAKPFEAVELGDFKNDMNDKMQRM